MCWWRWYAHTMGSCSSGGRVGRPLIIRVAVHSLSLFVHMTKCPWARHFNPNYSHSVDVVKYVLDKGIKLKQTKKNNKKSTEVTWKQQAVEITQEVKERRGHQPGCRGAFVLQDGLITFQSAICGDVLTVCIDVREPTGDVPSCPPASLTAVCCAMWSPRCSLQNNPHLYTHESVHLAPNTHIKSQKPCRHRDDAVASNRFRSMR